MASRFSGPAWRKSSKYLAFALGEVSLTRIKFTTLSSGNICLMAPMLLS